MAGSPMMEQYFSIKEKYKEAILMFRLGDFYEMFYDDAEIASRELEITLTRKRCGGGEVAPMCGVPYHSADTYIERLIEKGYKVAICEQTEEASSAKKLVNRDVKRVVTPGTQMSATAISENENNYLCCIYENEETGLAFVDITTGEFYSTVTDKDGLITELSRFMPVEIIGNAAFFENSERVYYIKERICNSLTVIDDNLFEKRFADEKIELQFEGKYREISAYAAISIGVLLDYLSKTQMCAQPQITDINFYRENEYMNIDFSTKRNLEIVETMREAKRTGSLLGVLDKTKTAMGGRTLKGMLEKPLKNCNIINSRLDAVEELVKNTLTRADIREALSEVRDIERIIGRIVTGRANGREIKMLGNSLKPIPAVLKSVSSLSSDLITSIAGKIDSFETLCDVIERGINDEAPLTIKEGGIIKDGYNAERDELHSLLENRVEWIAKMEAEEREKTGIKNLKIGFNRVFGYYIEISKSNVSMAPDHYIRKQTLVNGERYTTEELKILENKIFGAEDKLYKLEYQLFCEIRDMVVASRSAILVTARAIAELDVLASLAEIAVKNNYVKPCVDLGDAIDIKDGRHPVVESVLKNTMFVPNDTELNRKDRFSIITGPNMAGKSTYMRQVAVIVLMAQIGSFVPARSARIGIVDKIFTRVGASDDLAMGQSTFMVEMNEVANILNNATDKSLVILDEIGRGTSTYDGLSIAWAVVEYIANPKKLGAKTLFATHYHELTILEDKLDGVKNYCIAVKKRGDDIVFLRKIIRGGADESYGIEVAKLAGVNEDVIKRAKEIVTTLERINVTDEVKIRQTKAEEVKDTAQLGFAESEIIDALKSIDITTITPIEALNALYTLKKKADEL